MKRVVFPFAVSLLVLGGLTAAACGGDDQVIIPPPDDAGIDAHTGTGTGNDGSVTNNDGSVNPGDTGPTLLTNGAVCSDKVQCSSGFCTDGVCCDSACTGTCESCKVGSTPGTCTAVPDGTDPDTECGADPTFDGGAPDFDGGYDASLPPTNSNQCAGHCDGNRACAFATSGTMCGSTFCGDVSEQGSAQCDGKGHCLVDVTECSVYACPDGSSGCKTACKSSTDCLKPYFCDTTTSTCKPKSNDGTACTGGDQCTSGTCTTFYRDVDGDGHGTKKTATTGAITMACGTTAPAGFAATSDDCLDSNMPVAKDVHPGQTDYFGTAYSPGNGAALTFDYDCSGTDDKESDDSATCGFCDHLLVPEIVIKPPIIVCRFDSTCTTTDQDPGHACGGFGNCTADNTAAFPATTKCGDTAATITCGDCAAADGTSTPIPGADKQQRCH